MKHKLLCTILLLSTSLFAQTAIDWTQVESALGRKGALQPGNVYKFGLPRTDLKVKVGDVSVKPALALGGWLAFSGTGEARPDTRVRITVCDTPGFVSSLESDAAAAVNDDTPGTTS